MSHQRPHDQMERWERELIDRLPFDAEHVPDQETVDYDARLLEPVTTSPDIKLVGRALLEPGTPVELKTCQQWISDNGSGKNRRRGTWQVNRDRHEALKATGGVYCLLVLDGDELLEGRFVEADALELYVTSWTNGGYTAGANRAHVSWGSLIEPATLEVADAAE